MEKVGGEGGGVSGLLFGEDENFEGGEMEEIGEELGEVGERGGVMVRREKDG